MNLFAWTNSETGEVEYPDRELVIKALACGGKPNFEMDGLERKMKSMLCGSRQLEITPTHQDVKHVFNPLTDMYELIPGNPLWNDYVERNIKDYIDNHPEEAME